MPSLSASNTPQSAKKPSAANDLGGGSSGSNYRLPILFAIAFEVVGSERIIPAPSLLGIAGRSMLGACRFDKTLHTGTFDGMQRCRDDIKIKTDEYDAEC
jgi:hypothetical protein